MQRMMSVEELSSKLRPIFGKKIDELYFRHNTAQSYEEKNEILQVLMSLYQKNLSKLLDKGILIEPPKEGEVNGEYILGKVSYAGKDLSNFGLREHDWPRHLCVTGMSGSGKTTFAFNILRNLIEKKKSFLVFDWKKSFRPLMTIDNEIMTFTIGNDRVSNLFKTNINRPPKGVSPKEWINTLCDLLTESFSASFGVHKILLETLDEIFEAWGIYNGGKHYPNWQHVKKMLENKMHESKGRETGWYESAMRIASVLTFGDFGKVVSYDGNKSLSVEELFDKKVIFELNSLSNIEKKFFSEFILTYIYKLKKAEQNKIGENFNYAILVDEAHNVFLKNKTNFMSESVTDMVYREMREYGTSLICLDQHISKLSDTVTGNSACHIAFQQQLPQDIQDISSIMQLRDNKEIFSKLKVGSAVVKLSERYTSPFLVNVPFVDLRNRVFTDEDVQVRTDCLLKGIDVKENDPSFLEKIKGSQEDKMVICSNKNLKKIEIEGNKEVDFLKITKNEKLNEIIISNNEDLDKLIVSENENLDKIITKNNEELDSLKISNNGDLDSYLTKTQEVLLEFIKKKIEEKIDLKEIDEILQAGLGSGYYNKKDILIATNFAMREKFSLPEEKEEIIISNEKKPSELTRIEAEEKINGPEIEIIEVLPEKTFSKVQKTNIEGLDDSEKIFVNYLLNHQDHEKTTVELYKSMGFSARKGNVIKNKLLKKGLLEIEEQRNDRGWKKLIRLSKSYLQN